MLEELHIASLGVIEEAWLDFVPGLNVLTGETGAGKTMVTVALALALGARTSQGLVRKGDQGLSVEARFHLTGRGGAVHVDEDLAEWVDGEELVLARTVTAEGRSSPRVGGRLAPAAALASLGERLVEIHGQNAAERLAAASAQTAFLDRFAGEAHLASVEGHRAIHRELRGARARLDALDVEVRERERMKDLLAYQVREIEAAGVREGELAELAAEEARLGHAERLAGLAGSAEAALGAEGGGADGLRSAAEDARAMGEIDPTARPLGERLSSLAAEAEDAVADLRGYRETLEMDPGRLTDVQDRFQALKSLERKYGDGEAGILAYLEEARARLGSLEGEEGLRDELSARIGLLTLEERAVAGRVTEGRTEAAPRLAILLTEELQELGMPGGRLEVELVALPEPGLDGSERAEFRFAGGPGQEPMPLSKVASGGELSRTMLACRTILAGLDDVPTLVFDEVDAGIGGRTAAAVGRRLAGLARHRQVLVVTHLAQIAAHADRHFLVSKESGTAIVRPVADEERVAEIARMLSGSDHGVSLEHARTLLAEAATPGTTTPGGTDTPGTGGRRPPGARPVAAARTRGGS